MKKTSTKLLRLKTETIRAIQERDLAAAAGAWMLVSYPPTGCSCQISCGCLPGG